jgi:hypothetical protein
MLLRGGVVKAHAALSEMIQKPLGGVDVDGCKVKGLRAQ